MARFDFHKKYCFNCSEQCTHAKNCYKECLKKLYNEALSKIDLEKELEKKSPRQVAELLQTLGYNGFSNLDVYQMMGMKAIPRRTVKEANSSKQRLEAFKKTCLEKYGTENVLSKGSPIYEKRNKTVKERYGVNNVFQLEETKEKIKKSIFEHFGDYQGFYDYCSEKFLEKFGVENPWLLQSVQEKCIQTKIEKYGSINCNNVHMLSSIHRKVSEFLTSMNIEHENENTKLIRYFDENGKQHWPVPDIHLLGDHSNIIIEIQGDFYHANPNKYKETDLIRRFGGYKKAGDIWAEDNERKLNIEKLGYRVLFIWEDDINNGTFCQKILNFLK